MVGGALAWTFSARRDPSCVYYSRNNYHSGPFNTCLPMVSIYLSALGT